MLAVDIFVHSKGIYTDEHVPQGDILVAIMAGLL